MRLNVLTVAVLAIGLCVSAMAQDSPPTPPEGGQSTGRGMGRDFHGVGGQITAIEGSMITLQTRDGETAKVKVSSSTRIMKDRNEAKLSDFKVGDRIFAAGEQGKDGVWVADMLGQRTGAGGPPRGGMGGPQLKPEDNGKTYIAGEITKIDGTKLTIKKPDGNEQVIAVDDETSFRNGRDSVTLADLKVGGFVRGTGVAKDGIFVPKELNTGRPRGPRPGAAPTGAPPAGAPPADGAPQSQTQTAPDSK
jgi:hypothetical protein